MSVYNEKTACLCSCRLRGHSIFQLCAILYFHMGPRLNLLKGQCQKNFDNFFFTLKIRPGPHMNRQKQFHEPFRFCKDIRKKLVSKQWLTMLTPVSVQSLTTLTPCQLGQQLCCHRNRQLRGHVSAQSTSTGTSCQPSQRLH